VLKKCHAIINYFVILGPWMALAGNGIGDIYLVLSSIFIMIQAVIDKEFKSHILKFEAWKIFFILFMIWGIFSASQSVHPTNSITEILAYIRFPIYLTALTYWLCKDEKNWNYLIASALAACIFMAATIFIEKIRYPDRARLYGTWSQSVKANWFFIGYAMLPMLWLFINTDKILSHSFKATQIASTCLVFTVITAMFVTGQIYVTLLVILNTLVIFVVYFFVKSKAIYSFILFTCLIFTLFIASMLFPDVLERFQYSLLKRLPWFETSDYNMPMASGLIIAKAHWLIGVGPGEYLYTCQQMFDFSVDFPHSSRQKCLDHPHNIYIQVFAETGFIGLVLFACIVLSFITPIILAGFNIIKQQVSNEVSKSNLVNIALAASTIAFLLFPVSTYSQAFGQHLNYFVFTSIAFATALYKKTDH